MILKTLMPHGAEQRGATRPAYGRRAGAPASECPGPRFDEVQRRVVTVAPGANPADVDACHTTDPPTPYDRVLCLRQAYNLGM